MPGIFSKAARPARPGAYFNWSALPVTTVLPNIGSIVLVPIVHDWGPAETPVVTASLSDFQAKFGPTLSAGYKAVMQAYEGEGVAGRGGAGTVIAYRMTSTAVATASKTVQNTTPAVALTLNARYPGSYGNNLGWANQANALNPATQNDFQITLLGQVVETYTYNKTDIAGLVAQINAVSQWATATLTLSGTALPTATTITALAGGLDGSTLVGQDWTDMMTACGPLRFSLFAPYDLTDNTILASIQAWAIKGNLTGKRFMTVVGGALNESSTTAIARAVILQGIPTGAPQQGAENFVNLGVGSLIDPTLALAAGGSTLSTSQLAPRVAGIMAARGESMSLTFARLANATPGVMPTDSDILACFNSGIVCFSQDSNPDAPIRIEKGLTAYIGGDATKPYLIYRNPKFMRTMHGIELDITDWATFNAIGSLQVSDATRAYIVGHAHDVIQARANQGVIQDGFSVGVDPSPPPSDQDEFIALVYGVAFGRSVEQVFNLVYIS
jgi:hypothetical protein